MRLFLKLQGYDLAALFDAKYRMAIRISASEISEAGLVQYTPGNLFFYRVLGLPIRLNSGQVIAVMGTTAVAHAPYQSLLQLPFFCATFCVISCIFFVVY